MGNGACFRIRDAAGEHLRFLPDHPKKSLTGGSIQIGKVQHVHSGLHVGQGRPAAFCQRMQDLIPRGVRLIVLGDVLQHQDKTGKLGPVCG